MTPLLAVALFPPTLRRSLLILVGAAAVTAVLLGALLLVLLGILFGIPTPLAVPVPVGALAGDVPTDQQAAILQAALEAPCTVDPAILAGVGHQETGFGRHPNTWVPHTGGIVGLTQFSPGTWAAYGDGQPLGPATPVEHQYAATARYLCALGVDRDPVAALGHYSGCWPPGPGCGRTDSYPQDVLTFATTASATVAAAGAVQLGDLAAIPALDQYDPRHSSSAQAYAAWHTLDCSAAALDWLSEAYGRPLGWIDAAVAWMGGSAAIGPDGLRDHTGSALAAAIGRWDLPTR